MAKIPCKGKTTAGAACRAAASSGGLCYFHANPNRASELGRIGGRKNRSQLPEPPAASPMSAADLRDILVQAIGDVRSKTITPRTASALSQLCNSLHRVLQTADLESRLARLEQQLAEQGRRMFVETGSTGSRRQEEPCGETEAQPDDVDTKENRDGPEGRNQGSGEGGKA